MADSMFGKAVGVLLAITAILWLPYSLTGWELWSLLGDDSYGVMLSTLLALAGVLHITVVADVMEYPTGA